MKTISLCEVKEAFRKKIIINKIWNIKEKFSEKL